MHHRSSLITVARDWLVRVIMFLLWSQKTAESATGASPSPPPLRSSTFTSLSAVRDVIFTSDVLREKPAASSLDCGIRCTEEAQCAMFSFTPADLGFREQGAGEGNCRIHSRLQASGDGQEPAPGANSFSLDVQAVLTTTARSSTILSPCATTSDCFLPLTACYTDQCLCDGGRFYESSQDACVNNCSLDLGLIYHEYKNMDINNIVSFADPGDAESCKTRCTADPSCKAFTLKFGWCYFKYVTAVDVPASWLVVPGVVFYQRTCM